MTFLDPSYPLVAELPRSGNERPWEVSFASGQASRRVSRARVVVPPGAWSWVVTKYCRHPAYSDPKTHHGKCCVHFIFKTYLVEI